MVLEIREPYEEDSKQYQKIRLEEAAPADYVKKKLKASELIDNVSFHLYYLSFCFINDFFDVGKESPQKGKSKVSKISKTDETTPDSWVARDERLIRLVGPHPMNAEPSLLLLVKEGAFYYYFLISFFSFHFFFFFFLVVV